MLFFYIRHGDPIYSPDSLTELGKKQAESVAKRLALYGIDRIYSSTSNRAIQTAQPLCDLLKKEMDLLDFCNENYAANEFVVEKEGKRKWIFQDEETKLLFASEPVMKLGHNWYEHPELVNYKKGIDRVHNDAHEFFKALGYEHIRNTGRYKVIKSNSERVALFAHQGFGIAFLSVVLDIPYPIFANHFDICHTGMTVIDFQEEGGFAIPKVLTLSSDSHLYRDALPTNYNNYIRF